MILLSNFWPVTVAVLQIVGGDRIQMNTEHTAHVSFINRFAKMLSGAVLTVDGSGLLQGKHEAR